MIGLESLNGCYLHAKRSARIFYALRWGKGERRRKVYSGKILHSKLPNMDCFLDKMSNAIASR